MCSLPKGWEVKKLGDVCDIALGKTPTRSNKKFWDIEKETNNIWLSIRDLSNTQGKEIFDSREYISNSGAKLGNLVKKGTLLASFKLTLGRLAFAGTELYTNEAIASLEIKDNGLDNGYLYHYLTFFDWDAETKGDVKIKGKTLNKAKLKEIKTLIPPLPEQKRIVAILEKAFTAIDQAKANTEKNLKNARELFQSKLQETFDNGKLKIDSGEWEEKKLGEVCLIERGSSPRPIKKYFTSGEDGVNWIKIGDTKGVDKYIYSTRQKITKEGAKKSRHVQAGDFILSNSMSYGKPYIMKTDGYIHDGWFVLRLHNFVDTEYFFQLLSSPYVNNQFHNLASGSVVKNINGDLVKKVILPIPPFAEQKQIVKKLDSVSIETKKLETIYQRKITCLDELKKSILQKAFNGEI